MTSISEYDISITNSGRLRNGNITNYQGVYSSATNYQIGDVVISEEGNIYLSIAGTCGNPNLGNNLSDTNFWLQYSRSSSINFISAGTTSNTNLLASKAVTVSNQSIIMATIVSGVVIAGTAGLNNLSTFQRDNEGFLVNRTDYSVGPSPATFAAMISQENIVSAYNTSDNTIYIFTVDSLGVLTPVTQSVSVLTMLNNFNMSPNVLSNKLYIGGTGIGSNSIVLYQFDTLTDTLSPLPGTPFTIGFPINIAFTEQLGTDTLYAGVLRATNEITIFSINFNTNVVTQLGTYTKGTTSIGINFSTTISNQAFCAATNSSDNTISMYIINTSGVMTPVIGSPFPTANTPGQVAFSPIVGGNLFMAVAHGNTNLVSSFIVNTTTGQLTAAPNSPYPTGDRAVDVIFLPLVSGILYAAVLNFNSNEIYLYYVDTSTGEFTLFDLNILKISDFASFQNNNWVITDSNTLSTPSSGRYKVSYTITGTNSSTNNTVISYLESNDTNIVPGSAIGLTNVPSNNFLLSNDFIIDYIGNDNLSLIIRALNRGFSIRSSTIADVTSYSATIELVQIMD